MLGSKRIGLGIFIVFLVAVSQSYAFCGDGVCEGRSAQNGLPYEAGWPENWDVCPEDCGIQPIARNIGANYRAKDEIEFILFKMEESNPNITHEVIGYTVLGKPIYMWAVGNPSGGKFMFDGQVHGPEDCGTETGLKFFDWVANSNDSEADLTRRGNYLLFIPIINRDMYRRQNARSSYVLSNGTVVDVPYGVDLNRNFARGFGTSGSGELNHTYEFRGLYASSEPETQAVTSAMKKYKPDVYFNVHCGMEMARGYGNQDLGNSMISIMRDISNKTGAQTFQKYGPALRTGCGGGGYVAAQACAESANTSSWLFEISEWGNLPKNLSDYHTKWYHNALPLYLSAVKATRINVTENPGSGVVPVFPESPVNSTGDTFQPKPIVAPVLKITARPIPDFGDYRNGFLVAWDGTACENLAYAKSMGYDYVMYMSGMENCPGPINMKFYIEAPNYLTPQWELDMNRNYTSAQIQSYQDWFALKNNGSFPGNIATGWFYTHYRFRPIPDFQRQDVIDYLVVKALNEIEKKENPSKGFYFGGWSWDVPSLEGDFWSDLQFLSFYPARANGTGRQITISYWTGTCSGVSKGSFTNYPCFKDGYAAYYKKLFSETAKYRPGFKVYIEPYNMWSSYVKEVVNRSDVAELTPDMMCSESAKIDFLTDPRILNFMPASKLCSDTPDSATHVKNLDLAGALAVKGAWFNWFGRIGGTGDFAPLDSMRDVPARLKLIRVLPAWDNLNGVPLNERSFSSRVYESTESYADLNLIFSRNPKNSKIYVVVLNNTNVGIPGNYVAYKLDNLMVPTSEIQSGSFVDGRFYLPIGAYILSENNVTNHANNSENFINITNNFSENPRPKPKPEIIVNKTPENKEFSEIKEFVLRTKVNLTDKQKLKKVKDLVIQRGKNSIDFSGEDVDLTNFTEAAVEITENSIFVDSEKFPALDVPARLTFGNIPEEYTLLRNGEICRFPQCNVVSHNSGYLVVDVLGFSNYTVVVGYGYHGTYVKQDLQDIIVDGLGTFGASFVSWIEILILLGVIALGAGLIERYKK